MTLAKGTIEMIFLANGTPRSFDDFIHIVIGGKRLSSATVSKRLRDLTAIKVLEQVVMYSTSGRKVVGYTTTDRGRRVLDLAAEFAAVMAESKAKPVKKARNA